jgi:hypothetical protein
MELPAPSYPWSPHWSTAGKHADSNVEAISVDYAGMGVAVGAAASRDGSRAGRLGSERFSFLLV